MFHRKAISSIVLGVLVLGWWASAAEARTLRERLSAISDPRDVLLSTDAGVDVVPTDALDFFGPAVQRLAIRGTDFPVTSTVPGFSYVYNPQLQILERSTQLGPVFVERAETVGRGQVEVGASFLYASLDEVDGNEFGTSAAIFQSGTVSGTTGLLLLETVTVDSLRLENYWINTYVTYGLSDRWDVNVLLPLVYTEMRTRAVRQFTLLSPDGQPLSAPVSQARQADGDAFGVGDLLLRSKYRIHQGEHLSLAGAITLRLPTGREGDFHGLGDTTVTPTGIVSVPFGPHSLHGTLGFEVNADDLERTRARYTLGASVQLIKPLALLVDILGSSSLVDDEFEVVGDGIPGNGLDFVGTGQTGTIVAVPRSDLIDLAAGVKLALGPKAVLFVGAIVPLTEDGIRAEVIPTGGVEVGF